jgi:sugar lactone lactonase YvrE
MKLPILASLALATVAHAASFQTYQDADVVLGQPNFTSNTASSLPNGLSSPAGMAVDPTTGKVFVADFGNNRVLRFSSAAAAISGSNPEAVIGQSSFAAFLSNQGGAAAANTLSGPLDVFVDSGGRLWVADELNNRVLRFDLASLIGPTNPSADRVLGQPDFTTVAPNTTAAKMASPFGLTVDASGVLWVADQTNNRILRFDNAVNKANGANADGVLGQALFTTSVAATTASGMQQPSGVATDSSGRLWVADTFNNRVLRFDNAAAKANGANADGVLGQANFVSGAGGLTAATMNGPYGALVDASGNLWVGEYSNRRVTRFENAAALANGAAATLVLGQPNFTTNTLATTVKGGGGIVHLAGGPNGSLLAADYANNRVLRYSPQTTPTPNPNPTVTVNGPKTFSTFAARFLIRGRATDTDGTLSAVQVKVNRRPFRKAAGLASWRFFVNLIPGRNRVVVRAVDVSGVKSTPVRLIITRETP